MKPKRILIISQDAFRAGAPILLLNLIKTIKKMPNVEISVLLKDTGVLLSDFKAEAPTTLLKDWLSSYLKKKYYFARKFSKYDSLRRYIKSFDIILSNTITNGDLDYLLCEHPLVITYVHELENAIRYFTTEDKFLNVLKHSRYFLYPSNAVRDNLICNHGVDQSKFIYLPYVIPDLVDDLFSSRQNVRDELNIGENEYLILGLGTCDWRKGSDLFLSTMQMLFDVNPNVKALWVGSDESSVDFMRMLSEIKKMHLQEKFILRPSTSNPHRFFAAADLFYLSSREDPYPLVVLESAMMNLPCAYFPESGGAKEFLSDECGMPISYGRIDKAVQLINDLLNNNERRQNIANSARSKYLSMHTEDVVNSAFINILQLINE